MSLLKLTVWYWKNSFPMNIDWIEMKPTSTTLPSAFLFIFNCPADSSTVTSSMTLAHWATFDLWTSIDNPLVVRELPNLIHDNLCELTLDSIRNSCLWFVWDVESAITVFDLTVNWVIEQQMSWSLMPDLRRVWNLGGRSLTFQWEQKVRSNFL